jgi:hypothetical protein
MTAANREVAIKSAEANIREIRADERAQRQDAEYLAHKASEDASQVALTNLFKGNLKDANIFNDPDILPNKKEDLLRFKEWYTAKRAEEGNRPHPGAMMDLWMAIHVPSDDPRKIYNSDLIVRYADANKINANEAEKAFSWVANQRDENYVKLMAKLQGKMSTIRAGMTADPQWAAQGELSAAVQMEIASRATTRINELRRENKDPSQIFDPNSKEFQFSPGILTSVANDIRAQHRNLTMPRPTSKDDPIYKDLPVGAAYIGPDGIPATKTRAAGEVPPAQHATSLDIMSGYIENVPRTGQVTINAPARSLARQLNGKRYPNREAALEALKGLTERRQ